MKHVCRIFAEFIQFYSFLNHECHCQIQTSQATGDPDRFEIDRLHQQIEKSILRKTQ